MNRTESFNYDGNGKNNPPKTRYTDQELEEFKQLILKKLEEARAVLKLLNDGYANHNGTDDTSPSFKQLEEGKSVLEKEETSSLAARQQKFIQSLEKALIRIKNKTYGICSKTGKLIPKERLRSVPHTTLSIDAKREEVSTFNRGNGLRSIRN